MILLSLAQVYACLSAQILRGNLIHGHAGIGGLATAYALARSGHRVRVYEKMDSISQVSFSPSFVSLRKTTLITSKRTTGVRVPPNLSKILYDWGLHDHLADATRCRKSAFHSSKSRPHIVFYFPACPAWLTPMKLLCRGSHQIRDGNL